MREKQANTVSTSHSSRRRRLWDLPHACHCPVVGVCFPLTTLRHLVNKAVGGHAVADDYDLHEGVVVQCRQRNRLSEVLQKDAETRYSATVRAFGSAKSTLAVANLWCDAVRKGDVAGALWATLTHARCDGALQEMVLRDMHMLQHQAGAAVRVDVNRVNQLLEENSVLTKSLAKAQDRCTRVITEKVSEIEHLSANIVQLRATGIAKDTRIAYLTQDLEQLQASLPDYKNASRLQKKLEQLTARHAELELHNTQLRQQLEHAQRALSGREKDNTALPPPAHRQESVAQVPITLHLKRKTVLCVGGRHGNVANYRDVIEKAGGYFAHHDGGLEDSHNALDSSLAAADLVICQTGCISHNAYWRVKDFCKRTAKQCVFVENPSTSSMTRTLQHIAVELDDDHAT